MTVIHTPKASDASAGSSPPAALRPKTEDQPTEVLFPEAKRRERRRRLIVLAAIVVGPNGAVYADTNTGNTFTAVSALVEVEPDDRVLTLWKS